jgi:chromosome segregation ATPase
MSFFAVTGFIGFSVTPIGRAIARRISGGAPDDTVVREVQSLKDEVADLRDETQALRRELGEAHERLDFAERMLAQAKGKNALPAGGV